MRIRILSTLFGVMLLSSGANAATVEEFKAADWDGLAFTSDDTGSFTHCSVYATYKNGSTLYISYEAGDSWYFSVANEKWKLDEGGSYPVKFKVDGRGQIEGTGTALGTTQIGLPVETSHPFVGQLRRGNRLVISFQDNDYVFELSNSNAAMNAARDCARRHVKLGTHTPVVAKSGDQQKPQESEQAQETPSETQTSDATTTEVADEGSTTRETPAADTSSSDGETTTADNTSTSSDADKPAQASGEQQTFGPWVVTAAEDGNGNFVNCTAYGVQGDDQLILSYFSDNKWTFGLYRPAWKLDTNQTYYLWYNVDAPADAKDVVKRPVEAAEPTRIFFEVSDVEDIVEHIEDGTTLNLQIRSITGPAENYSYPLDQAHAAFEATRKCVSDHASATSTSAQGNSEGSTSEESSERGADTDTSATKGGDESATDSDQNTTDQNASDQSTTEEGTSTDEGSTAQSDQGGADTDQGSDKAANDSPPPLPEFGDKLVEELQVPGWKAAAFANQDDTFTHCAIKAEYENGGTLGFALTAEGELVLVVKHGDWSVEAGSWSPISYTLKGGTPQSGNGQAIDASTIAVDIGSVEDLGDTLRAATEVDVSAQGKDLSFDTSDIGPAIDTIRSCVANHAGGEASSTKGADRSSTETPPADTSGDSGQATTPPADAGTAQENQQVATTGTQATDDATYKMEAAGYTTALLIRSGYANHIILKGDDVPEAMKSHRAAWKIGDLIGLTDMVAGSPAEIKSQVFTSDQQSCDGVFTSAVDSASGNAEHLHSICKKADSSLVTVHYVVVPREAGGSYMLSLIDTGDGAKAEEIAGKVYSTAIPN